MTVYSVMIEDSVTGITFFEGPWLHAWMAEHYAETTHRDDRRVVIEWQMLNADWRRAFAPGEGRPEPAPAGSEER